MEVREIIAGVKRIAGIIQHLRGFVRGDSAEVAQVNLSEVVQRVIGWMAPSLSTLGVTLVSEGTDAPVMVAANAVSTEQILTNLISNARDAVRSAGSADPRVICRVRADQASIEVEDFGPGMSETVVQRIFDPFFTTKAPGAGMGLGLSLCHGLSEAMGARLTVRSQPGKGTRFVLQFQSKSSLSPKLKTLKQNSKP